MIRVKRTFGDESGTQITDDDIIRWINDAQNEIGQTQKLAETTGTQSTTEGTLEYDLPANFIEFRAVYYDNYKLHYLTQQEFDEYVRRIDSDRAVSVNTQPIYYTSWGDKISLYPAVEEGKTLEIRYVCFPAPVSSELDSLTLPLRYHQQIVELVLASAYALDENFEAHNLMRNQASASLADLDGQESHDAQDEYPFIKVRLEDV
jgi:hypothetical protein